MSAEEEEVAGPLCPIHMKALEPHGFMALCMETGCTFGVTLRVAQEEEARLKPTGEAAVEMLRAEHGMSATRELSGRVGGKQFLTRGIEVLAVFYDEQEANRALSAPDLYEALKAHKAASDHHDKCIACDWEPCREWWPLYDAARELTVKAMQAAEGRTGEDAG